LPLHYTHIIEAVVEVYTTVTVACSIGTYQTAMSAYCNH